jgi:hypothetical protein
MIENKYTIVEPDSPARCQGNIKTGQCPYGAVVGSKFCPRHGSNMDTQVIKETNLKNYRLNKWNTQLTEKTDSSKIKSLRDEIGILRILMEETLNKCHDSNDLLMYSNKISDLALKIEKLVTSCDKLETKLGLLMDKTQALQFANEIISVITKHIKDEDMLVQIAKEISNIMEATRPAPKDEA